MLVRGIERHPIFRSDTDRADFVARLAALARAGAVTVYAWALLPNHVPLRVRTGARPLAISPTVVREGVTRGDALAAERGIRPAGLRRVAKQQP